MLEPLETAKLEIAYCAKTHKSTDRDLYLLETMLTESHDRVLQRNTLSDKLIGLSLFLFKDVNQILKIAT